MKWLSVLLRFVASAKDTQASAATLHWNSQRSRWISWYAVTLLGLIAEAVHASERPFDPGLVIQGAVQVFELEHVAAPPLNDELSRQWLEAFVVRLDPKRMYFVDDDLTEFRRFSDRLDDFAKAKDFQFPKFVRARFQQRVKQVVAFSEAFLASSPDFSVDEEYPGSFANHAESVAQMLDRWRLKIKAELLIEKAYGRKVSDVQRQFLGRYQRIRKQAHEMSDERLCEIYINALASNYDPHSAYYSPRTAQSYERANTLVREYYPGLIFRQESGDWVISSLHSMLNEPAIRSELVGWQVIAVRSIGGENHDVVEMPEYDFLNLMRRDQLLGTEIILELFHPASCERKAVSWFRFGR